MRSLVALGIAAVALPVLFGCSRGPGPRSQTLPPIAWVKASENQAATNHYAESHSGPYGIKAHADVPMSSAIQNDQAVVEFSGHRLVVEFGKGQIVLDNTPPVNLPAGTKDIEVWFAGGKLSVTANGTDVPRPEASK
jgi:hypothetical protein